MERGIDAQDNAWHLFKYILKEHPDIKVLYAIKKNSPDVFRNLNGYDSYLIEYDTFKYYMYLYNASVLISTHVQTYIPGYYVYSTLKNTKYDIQCKRVFLQHGITHNHTKTLFYPKFKTDLFICGSNIEYNLLRDIFHQPERVLKYTGFARFDNLYNKTEKRQVLIMPTWRMKYVNYTKEQFEQTDFFFAYKTILTSSLLRNKLIEHNYELIYYNHIEFQKFNSSLEPFCIAPIKMKKFGEQSVQDMMKESKVLVTDYSSVYYDFLYMGKPIIFFLLNQDSFRAGQYGKDYDDVSKFGYMHEEPQGVINQIIKLLECDCVLEDKYRSHMNMLYPLHDNHNCERIYNEIKSIL